jgi:hypothetical protein
LLWCGATNFWQFPAGRMSIAVAANVMGAHHRFGFRRTTIAPNSPGAMLPFCLLAIEFLACGKDVDLFFHQRCEHPDGSRCR